MLSGHAAQPAQQTQSLPAEYQHAVQAAGSNAMVARTSSVFRHGSSVGEQLQALALRTGMSFSGSSRLKPRFPGLNFSDLKKQVRVQASPLFWLSYDLESFPYSGAS